MEKEQIITMIVSFVFLTGGITSMAKGDLITYLLWLFGTIIIIFLLNLLSNRGIKKKIGDTKNNGSITSQLGNTKESGSITSQLGNTKESGSITSQLGNTKESGSITSQLGNTKESGSITSQLRNHLGNTKDKGSITNQIEFTNDNIINQIGISKEKILEKIGSTEKGSIASKIDNNSVILGELKNKEEERLSLLYSVKNNVGDSLLHLEQVITQYKQIYKELIDANKKIIYLESKLKEANKKIEVLLSEKEKEKNIDYCFGNEDNELEL